MFVRFSVVTLESEPPIAVVEDVVGSLLCCVMGGAVICSAGFDS